MVIILNLKLHNGDYPKFDYSKFINAINLYNILTYF